MEVRVKFSESSEKEKSFSILAALLCMSAMKVWLNPPTHTVMVPHGLSGEKALVFSTSM